MVKGEGRRVRIAIKVIAQNVSGALHLKDALHRESTLETRTATHLKEDAAQFYCHDFEQSPIKSNKNSLCITSVIQFPFLSDC